MIYELNDTSKAAPLFAGFKDTCVTSCLQKVMGKIFVTDPDEPRSAMAYLGCFAFYAGEPDRELLVNKPQGYVIMVPQNDAWAKLIESNFPAFKKCRYALKKNAKFDKAKLQAKVRALPDGYEIKRIDPEIYEMCRSNPEWEDFVSVFPSKEAYFELGRGFVVLKDGKIVSGASSYSRYREGIELEVDTAMEERRKGLAGAVCAKLILSCLEDGLYPSWDAANMLSVRLAEKLGYEYDHEYICFGVD